MAHLPPPSRTSRGFTLLELVVVIVILAVLAGIAVPTFSAVIARTQDEAAKTELAAAQREAWAVAALDGAQAYTLAGFVGAAASAAPDQVGMLAAARRRGPTWGTPNGRPVDGAVRTGTGPSTAVGLFSVGIDATTPARSYLAMLSASGSCVHLTAESGNVASSRVVKGVASNGCVALPDGTVPSTGPGTPVVSRPPVLTVTPTPTGNRLNWTFSAGTYCVTGGVDETRMVALATVDGSATGSTWFHAGGRPSHSWVYKVRTCNPGQPEGESSNTGGVLPEGWSPYLNGYTVPYQAHLEVDSVTTPATDSTPGWTTLVTSYQVMRRTSSTAEWAQVGTLPRPDNLVVNSSYVDKDLPAGATFQYQMVPVTSTGAATGAPSNVVELTVPGAAQPALTAYAAGTVGKLSWTEVPGATYTVTRNGTSVGDVTATTFDDAGLAPSTTYTYVVTAKVGSSNAPSEPATVTTSADGTVVLTASQGTGAAWRTTTLTWNSFTGYNGANLYYRNRGATTWTLHNAYTASAVRTQTFTHPAGSATEYQVVVPVTTGGTKTSNTATSRVPENAASTLSATRSGRAVTVTWTKPRDYNGANLYYRNRGATTWTLHSTYVPSAVPAVTVTHQASTATEYRADVVYASGNPKSTNVATAVIPANVDGALTAVQGTGTSWRSTNITWTKPRDYAGASLYSRNKGATTWNLHNTYSPSTTPTVTVTHPANTVTEYRAEILYTTGNPRSTNVVEAAPGDNEPAGALTAVQGTGSSWRSTNITWTKPRDYAGASLYYRNKGVTAWTLHNVYSAGLNPTVTVTHPANTVTEYRAEILYTTSTAKTTNVVEAAPGDNEPAGALTAVQGTGASWRSTTLTWTKPRDYAGANLYSRNKGTTTWNLHNTYAAGVNPTVAVTHPANSATEYRAEILYTTSNPKTTNVVEAAPGDNEPAGALTVVQGGNDAQLAHRYPHVDQATDYAGANLHYRNKGATAWTFHGPYAAGANPSLVVTHSAGSATEYQVTVLYTTSTAKTTNVVEVVIGENEPPVLSGGPVTTSGTNGVTSTQTFTWTKPRDYAGANLYYRAKGATNWTFHSPYTAGAAASGTVSWSTATPTEFMVTASYLSGSAKSSNVVG